MEFFEDLLGTLGRNAEPGVGNDDADLAARAPATKQNAAFAGELEGVREQIAQRELQQGAVRDHMSRRRNDAKTDAALARGRREAGFERSKEIAERERHESGLDKARFDLRHVEQGIEHRT